MVGEIVSAANLANPDYAELKQAGFKIKELKSLTGFSNPAVWARQPIAEHHLAILRPAYAARVAANAAEPTLERVTSGLAAVLFAKCENVCVPDSFKNITLETALEETRSGVHKAAVFKCLEAIDDDKLYKQLKLKLPTYHLNGIFTQRITNDNFLESSGIFLVDLDDLSGDIEQHKAVVTAMPEVLFCFVSPSNEGLKIGIRIDPDAIKNDADFKVVFKRVEAYFAKVGYTIDPACKDVRRACFASYDPKIYINYDAEVFAVVDEVPEPTPKPELKPLPKQNTNNTESIVIERLTNIMLAATPGNRHQTRLHAGMYIGGCIAGGLIPEDVGVDILSQLSDQIADGGFTNQSEGKTLYDAIKKGKETPITNLFGNQHKQEQPLSFINAAAAQSAGYIWNVDIGDYIRNPNKLVADNSFSLTNFSLNGNSKEMRKKMLSDVFVLLHIALLGQCTIIYAKPNTGKTLLTLYLLIQAIIAETINAADIFYINADDTYKGLIEKLELAEQHGFNMLSPGHNGFEAKKLSDYLAQLVVNDDARGKVIILDTAKKFTDLMDKKTGSKFMESAREFVSHGGTLILLAHTNKNRDAEGKVVFGGTSDLVDDADCAYTLDEVNVAGDVKTVLFENLKSRGDCAKEAGFLYSIAAGQSYFERLESVKPLDEKQATIAKLARDAVEKTEEDKAVIDAIIEALTPHDLLKTDLVDMAHKSSGISKARINKVLAEYAGNDFMQGDRWYLLPGDRNAKVYSLLASGILNQSTANQYYMAAKNG